MNKQTFLFALLFLAALAAWQFGEIELAPEPAAKVENYQPDFTAKNLITTRFNEQGKRTERICGVLPDPRAGHLQQAGGLHVR